MPILLLLHCEFQHELRRDTNLGNTALKPMVLEPRWLRSHCCQVWFLPRPLSVSLRPPSVCPHMDFCLNGHMSRVLWSYYVDINHMTAPLQRPHFSSVTSSDVPWSQPSPITSSVIITSINGSVSKYSYILSQYQMGCEHTIFDSIHYCSIFGW